MSRTQQLVLGSLALLAFLYVMWGPMPTTTRDVDGLRWEAQRYGVFGYRTKEMCISFEASGGTMPDGTVLTRKNPGPRVVFSRDAFVSTLIVTTAIPALLAVFIRFTRFPSEAS